MKTVGVKNITFKIGSVHVHVLQYNQMFECIDAHVHYFSTPYSIRTDDVADRNTEIEKCFVSIEIFSL